VAQAEQDERMEHDPWSESVEELLHGRAQRSRQ
jgi:hypothetical protein